MFSNSNQLYNHNHAVSTPSVCYFPELPFWNPSHHAHPIGSNLPTMLLHQPSNRHPELYSTVRGHLSPDQQTPPYSLPEQDDNKLDDSSAALLTAFASSIHCTGRTVAPLWVFLEEGNKHKKEGWARDLVAKLPKTGNSSSSSVPDVVLLPYHDLMVRTAPKNARYNDARKIILYAFGTMSRESLMHAGEMMNNANKTVTTIEPSPSPAHAQSLPSYYYSSSTSTSSSLLATRIPPSSFRLRTTMLGKHHRSPLQPVTINLNSSFLHTTITTKTPPDEDENRKQSYNKSARKKSRKNTASIDVTSCFSMAIDTETTTTASPSPCSSKMRNKFQQKLKEQAAVANLATDSTLVKRRGTCSHGSTTTLGLFCSEVTAYDGVDNNNNGGNRFFDDCETFVGLIAPEGIEVHRKSYIDQLKLRGESIKNSCPAIEETSNGGMVTE